MEELITYIKSLPENIKQSIKSYTTINYIEFNKKIRGKGLLSANENIMKEHIHTAFINIPVLKNELIVYRGIKNKDHIQDDHMFISCSLDIDVAKHFTNISFDKYIMKIIISSGSKILPIYPISDEPSELEILLCKCDNIITNTFINKIDDFTIFHCMCIPYTSVKILDKDTPEIIISTSETSKKINQIINLIFEDIIDGMIEKDNIEETIDVYLKQFNLKIDKYDRINIITNINKKLI